MSSIGVENILLILIGGLYIILWFCTRKQNFHRIRLSLCNGIVFLCYGLLHDDWAWSRYSAYFSNLSMWCDAILIICLIPLYVHLIQDIKSLLLIEHFKMQ